MSIHRTTTIAFLFAGSVAFSAEAAPAKKTPAKAAAARTAAARLGRSRVAGVSVTGLTPHQARAKLQRALRSKLATRLILTDGVKRVGKARGTLGAALDTEGMIAQAKAGKTVVPLRLKVDRVALQKTLRALAPRFSAAAEGAVIQRVRGGVRVRPGAVSRRLDVPTSAQVVAAALEKNPAVRTVRLRVKKGAPKYTARQLAGITARIGGYSTRYSGSGKRTHNMRIAINAIDGRVVPPNGVFSLNDTVGQRTQARGYRTAPVFENGKLVPGIGGGVSQVTGTLFNAALLAGLPIVEYGTHSKPVPYVPIGRDATVAWGNFDMKFKNNTGAPIYISYKLTPGRATANLYGKPKPGRKVSVSVRSQKIGPRRINAQLYRTFRQNGKVVLKEKVGTSAYDWKPEKGD